MKMYKKIMLIILILILILSSLIISGCSSSANGLQDGYYTAEDKNGSHGWYEFVTIYVNDGKIVSVEYNAKNSSGYIKSWDMDYMRLMDSVDGTYPNEYTRTYANQFLKEQSANDIDAISGATHSYDTFLVLAEAVLEKAKAGDATVALVDVQHAQ